MNPAQSVPLHSGEKIAAIGQGTWHFAKALGGGPTRSPRSGSVSTWE